MNAVLKNPPLSDDEVVLSVDARGRLKLDPGTLAASGAMARQYEAAKRLQQRLIQKRKRQKQAPDRAL